MKTCNKCNKNKNINEFKKDKRRNDGYSSVCLECARIEGNGYYHRTKSERSERIKENRRASYKNNKEVENNRSKIYKEKNKEQISEYNKKYKKENAGKFNKYRINNVDKIRKYNRSYCGDRLQKDYLFKLSHYVRNIIRKSLKRNGYSKKSKTFEILGCSFEEFKFHIESKFEPWMSWENHGFYNGQLEFGWDIDHIIPLSIAKNEEELIRLNHYSNLQPLCSYLNRVIKGGNIQ